MLDRNVIFPSIIITLSACAFAVITQFDKPMYQDASVDASFFPTLIVFAQIILCAVLIIQHKLKKIPDTSQAIFSRMSVFGLLFLVGYAVLISIIGYLLASLAAFIFYLLFFKVRKPSYYIIAITFVITVYFLFGEIFYIALPQAMWS